MHLLDSLDALMHLAEKDVDLRARLYATRKHENAVQEFCDISAEVGYPMSVVDLIYSGIEDYATMRRATNGGGENSPVLEGEDDYYDQFMCQLAILEKKS